MYDDGIKSSGGDVLRKLVLAFVAALSCGVLYGQGDVTRAEIADVSHLIEYNNEALEAGTEGNVLLFVTVEENGRAEVTDVLSGLAHGLTQNAVEAIEGARHEPATFMGGRRIKAPVLALVRFERGKVTMPPRDSIDLVFPRQKGRMPRLTYTSEASDAGIQGDVVISGIVNKQGKLENATVVKGLPHGLSEEALKMSKMLKYRPATLDGKRVRFPVSPTLRFRLP